MRSTFLLVLMALAFVAHAVEIDPSQGGAEYNDLTTGAADGAFVFQDGYATFYAIGINNCFLPPNGRLSVGNNGNIVGGPVVSAPQVGDAYPAFFLAPFFGDVSGGTVFYQNDEANGIVTFDYSGVNLPDGSVGNFQVQLFDSNPGGLGARFLYQDVSGSATIGASNADGSVTYSGDASSGASLDVYCTAQSGGGAQAGGSRKPSPSRKPSASPSASPAPFQPRIRSVQIKQGSGKTYVDLTAQTADGFSQISDEGALTYTPNIANCFVPVNKRMRIAQNGAVLMGVTTGTVSGNNVRISEATAYGSILAPYWDNFASGGDVFYKLDSNQLVIQWKNVALKNHPGTGGNFELILLRNAVQGLAGHFMYMDTDFATDSNFNRGAQATVGLKFNSTIMTQHTYNSKVIRNGLQLDLYCNV